MKRTLGVLLLALCMVLSGCKMSMIKILPLSR